MSTLYAELHTFQCSNCRMTATSPARSRAQDLRCVLCLRFMRHVSVEPVTTDAQRALAARGTVYNSYLPTEPSTKRTCDECKAYVEAADLIRLGAGGKYCSARCADLGTEKHRVAMERMDRNLEALYQARPWLRPAEKESA